MTEPAGRRSITAIKESRQKLLLTLLRRKTVNSSTSPSSKACNARTIACPVVLVATSHASGARWPQMSEATLMEDLGCVGLPSLVYRVEHAGENYVNVFDALGGENRERVPRPWCAVAPRSRFPGALRPLPRSRLVTACSGHVPSRSVMRRSQMRRYLSGVSFCALDPAWMGWRSKQALRASPIPPLDTWHALWAATPPIWSMRSQNRCASPTVVSIWVRSPGWRSEMFR